jgi:hypothetical protein
MSLQRIEVLCRPGQQGKPVPLRFTFQQRTFEVEDIGRQWPDENEQQHMLVMTTGQQVFELVLARDGVQWYLNTIHLPRFRS